ncbi:hypothetical protein [Ferrovibrio sp.]|uniref:hypothetical protein n=1 Tax=Ferrovibrio sp. TaxID=1917215 RepID=UPI003D107335
MNAAKNERGAGRKRKLTPEQAAELSRLRAERRPWKDLEAQFGAHRSTLVEYIRPEKMSGN